MALPALNIALASTGLHCSLVLSPFLLYGIYKKSKSIILAIIAVAALDLMQAGVLFSPVPYPSALSFLHYNWIQKAIVFLVTLFVIWRSKKKGECGLTIADKPSAFAWAILVGVIFAALDIFFNQSESPSMRPDRETVFFQLTMPGLQEELLYRSLMLFLLDKTFGTPWKFACVQFGVGALITSALFTLGHVMIFDEMWQIQMNPSALAWVNQMFFAMVMCWLRYYTNSIWCCVLAHNLDNGLMALKLYAIR